MPFSTWSAVSRFSRPNWSSGPQSPQVEPAGRRVQRGLSDISAHLHQLLQAAQTGRQFFALGADAAAPIGEGDLADIDVAARVDGDAVRRDELAGIEPGMRVAEPRQKLARVGIDADPRAAIRQVDIDRHVGTDLADIHAALFARFEIEPG